jgi:hypothetical protein
VALRGDSTSRRRRIAGDDAIRPDDRRAGKTPSATLAIQGFQTDQTLLCDVEIAGSTLVVKFRSFGDGKDPELSLASEQYRPGARLITLSRESAQGMITTGVGGTRPSRPSNAT